MGNLTIYYSDFNLEIKWNEKSDNQSEQLRKQAKWELWQPNLVINLESKRKKIQTPYLSNIIFEENEMSITTAKPSGINPRKQATECENRVQFSGALRGFFSFTKQSNKLVY